MDHPPPANIGIDPRQRLYLARFGTTVEAVSFEDVGDTIDALAGRLGRPALALGRPCNGSLVDYQRYRELMRAAAERLPRNETWYHPRTPRPVRQALEACRIAGHKVKLHYGDPESGRACVTTECWEGFVARRATTLPLPVLSPAHKAEGGTRVYDNALVRIALVDHHVDLWRHPTYSPPEFMYVPLEDGRARLVSQTQCLDFENDAKARQFLRSIGAGSPDQLAAA